MIILLENMTKILIKKLHFAGEKTPTLLVHITKPVLIHIKQHEPAQKYMFCLSWSFQQGYISFFFFFFNTWTIADSVWLSGPGLDLNHKHYCQNSGSCIGSCLFVCTGALWLGELEGGSQNVISKKVRPLPDWINGMHPCHESCTNKLCLAQCKLMHAHKHD